MSKSAFSISDHERLGGDPTLPSSFPRHQGYGRDDAGYAGFDESLRHTPQLLWQALTPDARNDTLRRVQLINLLRQVNPNLQLCRRPTVQMSTLTADKGVQVPDVRYELPSVVRKPAARKDSKASYVAPGVRIQPRDVEDFHVDDSADLDPDYVHQATPDKVPNTDSSKRSVFVDKPTGLKVTITTGRVERSITSSPQPKNVSDESGIDSSIIIKEADKETKAYVLASDNSNIDDSGNDKQLKGKEGSSGDDDSVVVVLDKPPSEQGLERKYGQFFCRRCLRGWSSRSVWCVRHTCKVYIKQTCNSCNKLVNPYLVCRLPKLNNANKETK